MTDVVSASSGTYRSRVDGTIVLSVEIEPKDRQAALALFGSPGTPMALAALKTGFASAVDPEQKEPIGPLCKWLVMRCNEPEFWRWLNSDGWAVETEADAKQAVCQLLEIDSRKEIDNDPMTADLFHRDIRGPYSRWCVARGVVS